MDVPNGPAVAFTPDNAGLAVAGPGGPVTLYDLTSRNPTRVVPFDAASEMTFSPDGSKLVTWNGNLTPERDIDLCDWTTGRVAVLPHTNGVLGVAWHPNGKRIAIGTLDCNVYQWDVNRLDHLVPLQTLAGHHTAVTGLCFDHGGDLLATSANSEGRTILWDTISGQPVVRVAGGLGISFSPDDRRFAMTGYGREGRVIGDVATGRERQAFAPPPGFHHQVAFSPDGCIMAAGGENVVRFWNLSCRAHYAEAFDLATTEDARQLEFSPDGTGCLVRTNTGLWRVPLHQRPGDTVLEDGQVVRRTEIGPALERLREATPDSDGGMQASADGHWVALASPFKVS